MLMNKSLSFGSKGTNNFVILQASSDKNHTLTQLSNDAQKPQVVFFVVMNRAGNILTDGLMTEG